MSVQLVKREMITLVLGSLNLFSFTCDARDDQN
jgi:hypothetical protein